MKKTIGLLALILLFGVTVSMAGKKAGEIEYKEYNLDNGLRVILSEDKSAPIVAVNLWYHVGSAHEEDGRSGFAHFFEHMMFQGSENVGKAEHFQYINRAGGEFSGTTNTDRTNFFQIVPANQLNLVLWLEADRMRSLKITQENFENQRNAVKEERLMRIDNQPYGPALITSDTLAYSFKPYRHSVIGKMVDLDAARVEDVQAFFDRYYVPNNCVLTIVGDIDRKKTMKMIEEHFGDIPRGQDVASIWGEEPAHTGERRKDIDDKNANVPAVLLSYVVPQYQNEDRRTLDLIGLILTGGEASRMHQRLVKQEQAAVVVFGGVDNRKGPGQFRFGALSNMGVDIGDCERLIYEEIARLQDEGVDESELSKAKAQFKASFIQSRETVMDKAEVIQHYAYYHKDLAEINKEIDHYMKITSGDIQRAAKKYFSENNRTVVVVNPSS